MITEMNNHYQYVLYISLKVMIKVLGKNGHEEYKKRTHFTIFDTRRTVIPALPHILVLLAPLLLVLLPLVHVQFCHARPETNRHFKCQFYLILHL
jgi:hypothetical protein